MLIGLQAFMQKHSWRHKHAFSLIEAAIVLAIIGIVIGGIWVAASTVQQNRRLAENDKLILTAVEAAKSSMAELNVLADNTETNLSEIVALNGLPADFELHFDLSYMLKGNQLLVTPIWASRRGLWLLIALMNTAYTTGQPNPAVCVGLVRNAIRMRYWPTAGVITFFTGGLSTGTINMNSGSTPDIATIITRCQTADAIWIRYISP